MREIFDFVKSQEKAQNSITEEGQEADNEAIMIQEKHAIVRQNRLNEKEKWKIIMDFMRKNPRTLVDALPEPEGDLKIEQHQTMYSPVYDEIMDQENIQIRANTNSSEENISPNYNQDALILNSLDDQNRQKNILVLNKNQPLEEKAGEPKFSEQEMAYTNIQQDKT